MNAKISVIIPTTVPDRIEMLKNALLSIDQQEFDLKTVEVVVVSNYELSLPSNYKFILKVIRTSQKKLGSKLVLGSKASSADILVFLEDDDTFSPTKISNVYSAFLENKGLKYFKNSLQLVSPSGKKLFDRNFRDATESIIIQCDNQFIKKINPGNIGQYYSVLSSISIHRTIIEPIYDCLTQCNFDSDLSLFLSALDQHSIIKMEGLKLTNYRIHNSGSRSIGEDINQFIDKTRRLFQDVINTSNNLGKCMKNKQIVELITSLSLRQNLEYDRWRTISFSKFLKDITAYLRHTKQNSLDLRFIGINILFYFFQNKMINKYIESIQNSYEEEIG